MTGGRLLSRRAAADVGDPQRRGGSGAVFAMNAGCAVNYAMLLPVIPVIVAKHSNTGVAGLANTLFLGTTVCAELACPAFLRMVSGKVLFASGVLLLGVPSLVMAAFPTSIPWAFIVAALRGVGFGTVTVVGAALVLALSLPGRQGRALGQFGLATALPGVVAPSIGLALLTHAGAAVTLLITGVVCLASLTFLPAIHEPPRATQKAGRSETWFAVVDLLRSPGVPFVAVGFLLLGVCWGGTISIFPLVLPASGASSAAVFLVVWGVARATARMAGGWVADRRAISPFRVGLVAAVACGGIAILVVGTGAVLVWISAAVYGGAYGTLQTWIMLCLVQRSRSGYGAATALWAVALDGGAAIGASLLGGVATLWGHDAVFWAMPLIAVLAVPLLAHRSRGVSLAPASSSAEVS